MHFQTLWNLAVKPPGGWRFNEPSTDTEWTFVDVGNTRYFIFQGSDCRLFRNGKITKDWVQNFSIRKRYFCGTRISRGIYRKHISIRSDVLIACYEAEDKGLEICFLGFSQGGAVALSFQWWWMVHSKKSATCISIAGQKIFGWKGKKKQDRIADSIAIYRIKNDLVPKLPPLFFRHVGKIIPLKKHYPAWPWNVEKIHMSYGEYK